MVITDPKGEIYENNAEFLRDRGYKIVLLNFRNPQRGNMWNPLTLPYKLYKEGNFDKCNELLRDLAINILHDEKTDDPFWQNTSADYFVALAQGLFQDADEKCINIDSIIQMLTVGEEKYGASTFAKEYFKMKDSRNPAYVNAAGTIASGAVITSVTDATVPVLGTVTATGSISGSVETALTTSNVKVGEFANDSASINIGTWALEASEKDNGGIAVGKAGNAKVTGAITIVSGTYVTDVTGIKLA